MPQCGKTRNSLPCKFFSSNQFRVKFFSKKLLSRNFCEIIVAVKLRNFHTVWCNLLLWPRVWSKKNDTLSKIDIFQLRKCNFMQNLMFHEAAILTDEIFWVKKHFFFNKVQNFKFKNYWFFNWKQKWEILEKWVWNIFLDNSRSIIGTLMYCTILESLIPKVSADLKFIFVHWIVFLQ